jgi:hypothetical protein
MSANDMATVIDALLDKIKSIGGGGITKDDLETIITKTAGNTADAMRTALIPENKINPGISVYSHPDGDVKQPKARLTHETFFCGFRLSEDTMTPAEIDAINALDAPTGYEAKSGRWRAFLKRDGTKQRLFIHCDEAVERETAAGLPSMLAIALELKSGPQAVDLLALTAQLEAMRAKLAQVTAA